MSSRLVELREALRRRSKAIGSKVRQWTCERVCSGQIESLLVCIGEFRLRLWADGALWVHVNLGASRFSFHGAMGSVAAADVVSAAEMSLLASGEDEIVGLWGQFRPYDVESRS